MKRILCIVAGLVALFSCSSGVALEEPDMPDQIPVVQTKVVIKGTLASTTKSELTSDGKVLWSVGDRISVMYDGAVTKFSSTNTEPSATADFEGYVNVPADRPEFPAMKLYGVYPSATVTTDGKLRAPLNSAQAAVDGTFADELSIAAGVSSSLAMQFYNVCGLMEITLERSDIKEVYLSGNNGEILAGNLILAFGSDGVPSIASVEEGKTMVSLSKGQGTLGSGTKYYIVLPPTVFENGASFSFVASDGKVYKKSINRRMEIKRSVISYLEKADNGAVEQTEETYVEFVCSNFEAFCLKNFDKDSDGKISKTEALLVTKMEHSVAYDNVQGTIFSSLSGIEHFTNLESIEISAGSVIWGGQATGMTSVDLNSNTKLKVVAIDGYSNLEQIKVDACIELEHLSISSPCIKVNSTDEFYTSKGNLKSLDVTKNTKLRYLDFSGCNMPGSVDLRNNTELVTLCAYYNEIEELLLGNHPKMDLLYLARCTKIKGLNLKGCPELTWMSVFSVGYEELDLTANSKLELLALRSYANVIFPERPMLYLKELHMDAMDEDVKISNFPNLEDLSVWGFKSLDLSGATKVKRLWISSTYADGVDISPCTVLEDFETDYWSTIPVLDISSNSKITKFTANGAEALKTLYIGVGQEIEGVTVNRSESIIHPNTRIVQKGSAVNEDFSREEL